MRSGCFTLKFVFTAIFVVVIAAALGCAKPAACQEVTAEQYKALEERVRLLEEALKKAGIQIPEAAAQPGEQPEQTTTAASTGSAEFYHTPAEKRRAGRKTRVGKQLEFNGLLEAETWTQADKATDGWKETNSHLWLRTGQLGLHATIGDVAEGNLVLLYEEETGDPLYVDEGSLKWKDDNFDITAGKFYPPFGTYNTHFISYPLTLELGETQRSAVMFHYAPSEMFDMSASIADGEVEMNTTRGAKINDFCLRLDTNPKVSGVDSLTFGAQYFSDIADTDADILGTASLPSKYVLLKRVGGLGLDFGLTDGKWNLEMEYIGAMSGFDPANLDANSDAAGDKPSAWNLELAYVHSERIETALKLEGSSEFAGFPRTQFGIDNSWKVGEGVTFSVEFLHGKYGNGFAPAAGTSLLHTRNSLKTQFAIEF